MAMTSSAGGGGKGRYASRLKPMSDMNVTPFVDVMLVLLIVFMIAAPMMTQGVQVALPKANAKPIEQSQPIEVNLKKDGNIYISQQQVPMEALVERLRLIQENRKEASILLRADADLNYGAVMKIMAALQAAGMVDVGMVTEPVDQ